MNDTQQRLIELALKVDALKFGEFTLKSGRISPYFFNAGAFNTGETLRLLGEYYAQTLIDSGIAFDMLFGPAYKGIPLACTVAIALSQHHGMDVPYCFNRKEAKTHGEGGILVGSPLKGRVIVVDDVISAGTAMRESAEIIQNENATLTGALIAMNRQERGQGKLSAIQEVEDAYNMQVLSVINLETLISFSQNHPQFNQYADALNAYKAQYGA